MKRSPPLAWLLSSCVSWACTAIDGDAEVVDVHLDGHASTDRGETGADTDDAPVRDTGDGTSATSDTGDAPPRPQDGLREGFDGVDGTPWPDPWEALGGVRVHAIDGGRGRLEGPAQTLARMGLPDIAALDFDVRVTVELAHPGTQRLGLWVRHDGGLRLPTASPGHGYAVVLGGPSLLGLWRERAGVQELVGSTTLSDTIEPLTPHRVRLQCVQMRNATLLRAKVWRANASEPDTWMLELIDVAPELQDVPGDIAIDLEDATGSGSVWVDDLVLAQLPS